MKKLELNQMENVQGGKCGAVGWAGFAVAVVVSAAVIGSVASGGTFAPVLLTAAGKFATASLTAAGLGTMAETVNPKLLVRGCLKRSILNKISL